VDVARARGRRGISRRVNEERGTRGGGIRTRISVSYLRAVRPSSGIGTLRGDTMLCVALLSYGTRWRAAFAHARRTTIASRRRDSSSDRSHSRRRLLQNSLHLFLVTASREAGRARPDVRATIGVPRAGSRILRMTRKQSDTARARRATTQVRSSLSTAILIHCALPRRAPTSDPVISLQLQ
jgi:hypothetical protein